MEKLIAYVLLVIAQILSNDGQSNVSRQVCTLDIPIEINPVTTCDDKLDKNLTRLEEKIVRVENKATLLEEKIDHILGLLENNCSIDNLDKYPSSPLLHSCEEIKSTWPDSPSDYYIIADTAEHAHHVYCNMERLCGDSKGGWMRVAYLNMTDSTEDCPQGFKLYEENGIRACGRQFSDCQSVKFPSYSINYSQVCGQVIGYQKGSTDAVKQSSWINTIDGAYVDGVSLTRGSPRQHIWTFIAALQENSFASNGVTECPCASTSPVRPPSFVGNDYFCESGNPTNWDETTFYTADPLWDGKQCGLIEEVCCNVTGIPWFHKVLNQTITDYIELRVCGDQGSADEDSPVGFYEIYVK